MILIKKKKQAALIIPVCLFSFFSTQSQQKDSNLITPSQALANLKNRFDDVKTIGQILFNPTLPHTTPPIPNPYPTTSINEKLVDGFFGSSGLNVDADLLRIIKNFYFYLEYLVKLEYAARLAGYAHKENIDVLTTLEKKGWPGFVDLLVKKKGSWSNLISTIDSLAISPDYSLIQGSIISQSWQNLISTPFWQAIPVTPTMLLYSTFWQEYCKYAITQSFGQDESTLQSLYQLDQSIFRFIPNIEVAYYHEDFSHLRNAAEYQRLRLILNNEYRARLIKQSIAWSKFIHPKTGTYNLEQIHKLSNEYQKTDFYQLISIASGQKLDNLTQQALTKKLPLNNQFVAQPYIQEMLQCLAMITNLQAQTAYLFDSAHLKDTIAHLSSASTKAPFPLFLMHAAEDEPYLEDLNTMLARFKDTASNQQSDQTKPKLVMNDELIKVQDFSSWLGGIWSDIKQTGQDAFQGLKDVGTTIVDEAEAVGYGVAGAFIGAVNPQTAQLLLQKSKELQQKVSNDISQTMSDGQNLIDDTAKVSRDTAYGAGALVGSVLSQFDENLGKDVEGYLDARVDQVIDLYADLAHVAVASAGGIIRLSFDAVNVASTIIADSVIAAKTGDWQGLGQDALNGIKNIAYDVVTSIMSTATFVGRMIVDQIKDLIKVAGYLVSIITDLTVDTFKAIFNSIADTFSAFGWQGGAQAMQTAADWTQNHRRAIEATVTTGLLVAAVVATDGLALPILALTVGPQLFQVAGGWQADDRAIEKKAEEHEFVNNYQTYVANNKIISDAAKNAWQKELKAKYDTQLTNQERELGFYQNFLQSYFVGVENQMAYYLGQSLIPQLTPDAQTGLFSADVGAVYGFKTGVLDLNPSQGFSLYSSARKSFSQEIAVSPAFAVSADDQKEVSSDTPRKFWFNQRETVILPSPTKMVHVKIRPIYTLNNFAIGLMIGGQTINLENIKKTGLAPIDSAQKAKMLVYKKDGKQTAVTLQLYEHEGKGWFATPSGPTLQIGQWYHLKMNLDRQQLNVTVWQDGQVEPNSQTFQVSETDQKIIGIISSGACTEYEIIAPSITPQANPQLRPTGTLGIPSEKERSIAARKETRQLRYPIFGSFNLQPIDKSLIARNQYIYTSNATKLIDSAKKQIPDYIVFGQSGIDNNGNSIVTALGLSPLDALAPQSPGAVVISLITQKAFDSTGKTIASTARAIESFAQTHGSLPDALTKKLFALRLDYATTLIGPFSFGKLSLQAISPDAIINGLYIYKAISPTKELQDSPGKPVKDKSGQLLYDYFITKMTNGALGVPYDPSITTIRSLITGYEYDKNSSIAQPIRYDPQITLNAYQQTNGSLPPEILTQINASRTFYLQKISSEQAAEQTPPAILPIKQILQPPQSLPLQPALSSRTQSLNPLPAQQSLQERTEQAEGGDVSFGG